METSTSNQVIDLVKMISLTVLGGILAWVSVWLKMKIDNRKEDKEKKHSLYRNIASTLYNINRYAQNQEKSKLLFIYHQKLYYLIDEDPEEKSIQKTQAEYHQQTQAKLHYILLDQLYELDKLVFDYRNFHGKDEKFELMYETIFTMQNPPVERFIGLTDIKKIEQKKEEAWSEIKNRRNAMKQENISAIVTHIESSLEIDKTEKTN